MKEREIDLLDMMTEMLSRWKGLFVALIIGGVLMGGVSYIRSYQNLQKTQKVESNVEKGNEADIDGQLAALEKRVSDAKKAEVWVTIDDEEDCSLKTKYLQESVYMQLDPFNIEQIELVYNIQAGDESRSQRLGSLYQDMISNVGLYDWVEKKTGIGSSFVKELIYVEASSSIPFSNGELTGTFGSNSIKIKLMQKDEKACKQLADAVKSYMEQQQEKLSLEVGDHELRLISETIGIIMSETVMSQQIEYRNACYNLRSTIATAKAAFSEDQKQYYNLLTMKEGLGEEELTAKDEKKDQAVEESPTVSKKYILLGAVLFAFIYLAILMMKYIFNSKLRANDELQNLYSIPQIGAVVKDSKKKIFIDKWIDNLRHYGKRKFTAEQSMELAFAAVKIATVKNGLDSVGLLGCNLSAGADKVCGGLKAALEKEGIKVTVLDNVLYDAEAMEQVDALKGAVLVEKAGSTLYNEIIGELELLKRQEIPVLGGIIVE